MDIDERRQLARRIPRPQSEREERRPNDSRSLSHFSGRAHFAGCASARALLSAGFTTTNAFAISRSPPSQGLLRTRPAYQRVEEPPPSRFIPSVQPSLSIKSESSAVVIPTERCWRPSTSTKKKLSLFQPIAERGWRRVSEDVPYDR